MENSFTIQQLAKASDLSRAQVEQWISRGHFKPENPAQIGKARAFTMKDAVSLGALAELTRIGVAPGAAALHVQDIYAFDDDDALLVMSQGQIATEGEPATIYEPSNPIIHGQIVRARDLAMVATDPAVRSMAVVNLSAVERRIIGATSAS